jgi:CRP-like cAMP-binding protein
MTEVRSYLQTLMAVDDQPLTFEAGQYLFKQGDPASEMYVVRTGSVTLEAAGRTLETVGPGGVIGEMALIDPAPRSATAVAGDGCTVTVVNEYTLLELVRKVPGLSLEIMRIMAGRLRRAIVAPTPAHAKKKTAAKKPAPKKGRARKKK